MKRLERTHLAIVSLGLLLIASAAQIGVWAKNNQPKENSEQNARPAAQVRQSGSNQLAGTWDTIVTLRICQTGAAIRSFSAMNTFAKGGTMQEYGVGSAPAPRGPGFGTWNHLSENRFYSSLQFFRFNADGTYAGKTTARRYIELDFSGNSYVATSTAEFYDLNGVLFMTACSSETGNRFL